MANIKKRSYDSEGRKAQAALTKSRILDSARKLFQSEGFETVTIQALAKDASVSAPTIYALFKSKRGVLKALMDEALPPSTFASLVKKVEEEESATRLMHLSAKIAREIYDAERALMDLLRGAAMIAPEFRKLEEEREERRYQRQKDTVRRLHDRRALKPDLSLAQARDILWTFTGRDMYRLLVIERGWTADAYEKWIAETLILSLLT